MPIRSININSWGFWRWSLCQNISMFRRLFGKCKQMCFEALRQSNAQFCSVDVLGRLGIKLRSPERGERGWDVFLLDYSIDSPLHVARQSDDKRVFTVFFPIRGVSPLRSKVVFTPNIMQKYDRAFSFLWKLRTLGERNQTSFQKVEDKWRLKSR